MSWDLFKECACYLYLTGAVAASGSLTQDSSGSRTSQSLGRQSKDGCEKLLFGQLFPNNCMKLNEFGTSRGVGG